MKKQAPYHYLRTAVWFLGAGLCMASLVGAPFIHSFIPLDSKASLRIKKTKQDLEYLGLADKLSVKEVSELIEYQVVTGKNLPQVLRDETWLNRFGLTSKTFKATWYVANPFDLLPLDLKIALQNHKKPIKNKAQLMAFCRKHKNPKSWKKPLKLALIETTPSNLWRTAQGKRPYARNGEFLEPIVMEKKKGVLEIRDGHIAIDPKIIPLNSEVFLIAKLDGRERILKVKASDTGGAIKGRHVDLPIHLAPGTQTLPYIRFPKEKIGNASVEILMPMKSKKS